MKLKTQIYHIFLSLSRSNYLMRSIIFDWVRSFAFLIGLFFLISTFTCLQAIEVGGSIDEDTIWSPTNNPYEVVQNIVVEENATLRILPGTVIKVNSARLMNMDDYYDYFHNNWDGPVGYFLVYGSIIAEGTETDSIYFMRRQEEEYYKWGGICLPSGTGPHFFKHCVFKQTGQVLTYSYYTTVGTISFFGSSGVVEKCSFTDFYGAIYINGTSDLLIKDNYFGMQGELLVDEFSFYEKIIFASHSVYLDDRIFIANNRFNSFGNTRKLIDNLDRRTYLISNEFINNEEERNSVYNSWEGECYALDNEFHNTILYGRNDNLFVCRENTFLEGSYLTYRAAESYMMLNDFLDGGTSAEAITDSTINSGFVYCNKAEFGGFTSDNIPNINNISKDSSGLGISIESPGITSISNCNIVGCDYAFLVYQENLTHIYNSIILENSRVIECYSWGVEADIVLRNCIIDFELPYTEEDYTLVDGGNNIYIESADSVFIDWQNGDFRLRADSPAIDAGSIPSDLELPVFDYKMNQRIYDGNGDGVATIDIGAHEYASVPIGSISGYLTDSESGEPIQYAYLQFGDIPGNCAASDSSGYYHCRLPDGVYDVKPVMALYEDVIVEDVEVYDNADVELDIVMSSTIDTVSIQEYTESPTAHEMLKIYPNPVAFQNGVRESTRIWYNVSQPGQTSIKIYNLKGQRVKTVIDSYTTSGEHYIEWNGKDDNNLPVSSGMYFLKMTTSNHQSSRKLLLLK